MDIRISEQMRDRVSSTLIAFVEEVLAGENLEHERVDIWSCDCEGLCEEECIMFGLCETEEKTRVLFLYEVAHVRPNKTDWWASYWHKKIWYDEYDRLCRKYLGKPASELPSFAYDGDPVGSEN